MKCGGRTNEERAGPNRPSDARLLALTGQASYAWDIASDKIAWSANFASLTGIAEGTAHASGRSFEKLIQAEGSESRFGLVRSMAAASPGATGAYQCIYALSARHVVSGEPVWLEDTGVWEAGDDGRPKRAEGVVRVISERRKREEGLRRKSDFDDLTGLPNRRYLEMKIADSLKDCLDQNESAAVVIVGLDRFDLVNELYGFSAGDEMIRKCAERIAARARGDDIVARFSGAKFGIVLRQCSEREIYTASRRFLDCLQQEVIETSAGPVSASAAVGACLVPKHAITVREAVAAASAACKAARRENGYRIGLCEDRRVRGQCLPDEAARAAAIASACSAGDFGLAFQPVVESQSGRIAFHECLARMDGAGGRADTSGGNMVSVAERLGLVRLLDHRSLELVLATLGRHEDASLSLNVSNETVEDPLWLSRLANGLNSIAGGASRLIVEITESQAARDLRETGKFVSVVRGLGCRVAIDDFGAGFTSFANLKRLPVDIIKIDGAFAGRLAEDAANQTFIRSLLAIAGVFGAKTVVEWVEDSATARLLTGWGVDYLQGHLFGAASTTPRFSPTGDIRNGDLFKLAG